MDFWTSLRSLDDDEPELGVHVAECLWWENNVYKVEGNVLLWHRGSKRPMQSIETRKLLVEEYN
jgi:hypothetical protein